MEVKKWAQRVNARAMKSVTPSAVLSAQAAVRSAMATRAYDVAAKANNSGIVTVEEMLSAAEIVAEEYFVAATANNSAAKTAQALIDARRAEEILLNTEEAVADNVENVENVEEAVA